MVTSGTEERSLEMLRMLRPLPALGGRAMLLLALMLCVPAGRSAAQISETSGLPEVNGWSLGPPLLAGVSEQAVADLATGQLWR